MKIMIVLLSILSISSAAFSAERRLTCGGNEDISVSVQLSGSTVKNLEISQLGSFTDADLVSYDGNEIGSKTYEKKSTIEGVEVTQKAKFGIQKIGSIESAYLSFSAGEGAEQLETLLICK